MAEATSLALSGASWSRAGFESLAHAHSHAAGSSESDRRVALHSLDAAIEGLITAYVQRGPGAGDESTAAANARREKAWFKEKRDYVFDLAGRAGVEVRASPDDYHEVRSVRNRIQHSGEWIVPSAEQLSLAFTVARQTCLVLECLDQAAPHFPERPIPDSSVSRPGPEHENGAIRELTGRALAQVAWEVSRSIDPERDGLHVRVLADALRSHGVKPAGASSLYDALNRAHPLFDSFGGAVWVWKEPTRDVSIGLYGSTLADLIEAVLRTHDPHGHGMHAGVDMMPVLERWMVPVRGQDIPATIRSALAGDPRFEKVRSDRSDVRTLYRLRD